MPRHSLSAYDKQMRLTIAGNLRRLLDQRGETNLMLSNATGIPRGTIGGYTNASSTPSGKVSKKLAEHFGVPVGELDPRYNENNTFVFNEADQKQIKVIKELLRLDSTHFDMVATMIHQLTIDERGQSKKNSKNDKASDDKATE